MDRPHTSVTSRTRYPHDAWLRDDHAARITTESLAEPRTTTKSPVGIIFVFREQVRVERVHFVTFDLNTERRTQHTRGGPVVSSRSGRVPDVKHLFAFRLGEKRIARARTVKPQPHKSVCTTRAYNATYYYSENPCPRRTTCSDCARGGGCKFNWNVRHSSSPDSNWRG